jgi:hypothetical protein
VLGGIRGGVRGVGVGAVAGVPIDRRVVGRGPGDRRLVGVLVGQGTLPVVVVLRVVRPRLGVRGRGRVGERGDLAAQVGEGDDAGLAVGARSVTRSRKMSFATTRSSPLAVTSTFPSFGKRLRACT